MDAVAEKREARRRRILENSESRLQRITGRLKDSNRDTEESDGNSSRCLRNNVEENKEILEVKRKDFLEREDDAEIREFDFLDPEECTETVFSTNPLRHVPKEDYPSLEPSKIFQDTPLEREDHILDSPIVGYLMSPISCIFLALVMNILQFGQWNSALKMGILLPYLVLALTKIYLGAQHPQSGGSFLAVLILCNIKPEIVTYLRKVMVSFNTLTRELAIYMASFVMLNWLMTKIFAANSSLTFK